MAALPIKDLYLDAEMDSDDMAINALNRLSNGFGRTPTVVQDR